MNSPDPRAAAPDGDLLLGYEAIAGFLGVSDRQARHLAESVGMPTFRLGGRVSGRKSSITAWLAAREAVSVPGVIGP